MGRWHVVKAAQARDSSAHCGEFVEAGRLFSVVNESSQNAIDNPMDPSRPVKVRYALHAVPRETLLGWLGPTWQKHVGSPRARKNGFLVGRQAPDIPLVPGSASDPITVLLIEDYGTTGLRGEAGQIFLEYEADQETPTAQSRENLLLWFLRAEAMTRPQVGRGGSRGLGKKANPLASEVGTFFVVSARKGLSPSRILAGQTNLPTHAVAGRDHEGVLSFGKDLLKDPNDPWSWLPIDDKDEIDRFCQNFCVTRRSTDTGTSLVIPLPIASDCGEGPAITVASIEATLLANWSIPIRQGWIQFELADHRLGSSSSIVLDEASIDERVAANPWQSAGLTAAEPRQRLSFSSPGIETDTKPLQSALAPVVSGSQEPDIVIGHVPNAPASWAGLRLPERTGEQVKSLRGRLLAGETVTMRFDLPVYRVGLPASVGRVFLAVRKSYSADDSTCRFQRGSLHVAKESLRKGACYPGFAALCWVPECRVSPSNDAHALLRASEGPAHLEWSPRKQNASQQWKHADQFVACVRELPRGILRHLIESSDQAESLWTFFEQPEISDRNLTIMPLESGFSVKRRQGVAESLVGRRYVVRMGYPVVSLLDYGRRRPDARDLDVNDLRVEYDGCRSEFVHDKVGQVPDRLVLLVDRDDFKFGIRGLNTALVAQVIVTESRPPEPALQVIRDDANYQEAGVP
jgi:hypothetical protein